MKLILDKLNKIKHSPERSDYHPELFLGRHIALAVLKAHLLFDNINLKITALLHDICKPDSGELKHDRSGFEYISNPDHPKQAYEFCRQWDVHNWIRDMGADYRIVEQLVLNHMRAKALLEGKKLKYALRLIPYIDQFTICDDMVHRIKYSIPATITLPNYGTVSGNIQYIGQSPVDIRNGKTFTITIGRVPLRYNWEDIPTIIKMNTKVGDPNLVPYINTLVS